MHEINHDELGLLPAHLEDLEGMLFVCLAETPPDFAAARAMMAPILAPQRMAEAKVAKIVDYEVSANWKLVWENNRECYHCNVNHPQYIKANFDHFNSDDTTPRVQERIDAAATRHAVQCAKHELEVTHKETGMATFPGPEHGLWFSANRTTLTEGYVSESMDGQQVAPLMGDYTEADVGTMRCRTMPNMWNHSSCDHVVSTRLLPTAANRTQARVMWLVHSDAEEGRDYELEKLMPFWQLTSEQDWELCEFAQTGISSSAYRPGPYSTHKEYNVDAFVRWYLEALAQ
jgi:Rieske 2Fe-2S family protein